jgi:hypothetical protein
LLYEQLYDLKDKIIFKIQTYANDAGYTVTYQPLERLGVYGEHAGSKMMNLVFRVSQGSHKQISS